MLIKIKENQLNVNGGKTYNLENGDKLILFESPNHPRKNLDSIPNFKNFNDYTNYFKHDSFIHVDNFNRKIRFVRDWPGNIPAFYYHSKLVNELIISDDINVLAKSVKNLKPSKHGLKLFITGRKHYHGYTIYKEVYTLHAGLCIELDLKSFNIRTNCWYKPFKKIKINDPKIAKQSYLDAIDSTILRLIPKEKPSAIMFSGGSDSTFLLDRMVKLGYKKIDLFTICVNGETLQYNYANEKAKMFNMEVKPIYADKKNIFQGWKKLFKLCYHYLSDLRIDGIFAPSVHVLKEIKEYYKGKPISLVWGSQYAIASPVVSTKAIIFKFYVIFILIKISKYLSFLKKPIYNFSLRHMRSWMLEDSSMPKESLEAFKDLYINSFNEISHPDELLNLHQSTDYNHLKHWWMDWRNKASSNFYKNAVNIFPFHDREFQESTMPYSLSVRIGGLKNIIDMPNSYKNLFFSLFEKRIPISSIRRGNYVALPEYFSLFRTESFYNFINEQLNKPYNIKLVRFLVKELKIDIPSSYQDLIKLNTKEIEKLTGIIFLAIRLKQDGVLFDNK